MTPDPPDDIQVTVLAGPPCDLTPFGVHTTPLCGWGSIVVETTPANDDDA